jgi:DNA (cytosine-5)-methyltransferase 1
MVKDFKIIFFRKKISEWFKTNRRDFPWRKENLNNYQIIISEILLQRTKAETVAKYFHYFLKKYPNWDSLSSATLEELEDILKPLGLYKHRAKRIKKITNEYLSRNKKLPVNQKELQESQFSTLYIQNAYELFLLNKRTALLDVNMSRVLSRFFYPKEFKDVRNDKEIQAKAKAVINVKNCKELNWAILDFAALICTSRKPKCEQCPLKRQCEYNLIKNTVRPENSSEEPQLSLLYNLTPETSNKLNKPLKLLSLFSGCGGMDLGFEGGFLVPKASVNSKLNPDFVNRNINDYILLNETKFQTVFANDIIPDAKKLWANYFQKKGYNPELYHIESIVDLVKMHKSGIKIFPENVDIVTGGFPCQDFSVAGKRNGFNSNKDHKGEIIKKNIPTIETRGHLYIWMKEVIKIVKPKIFIAENVKGLVNLSNVKEIIQEDFSNINGDEYLVLTPQILHAAEFGVPQSRERVFFIGINKSQLNKGILEELSKENINSNLNPYPSATHYLNNKTQTNNLSKFVPLKEIFRNLKEPEFTNDLSQMFYSKAKYMGKHCQGQIEINLDRIGPTIRSEHHGNIEFRRLASENGGKITNELFLGLKERRLTPRECALIQTFPPNFEFILKRNNNKFFVSPSSAYKLIGNAVPPLLAYHLAKRIEKLWEIYFK